jgi:hypothetical protein
LAQTSRLDPRIVVSNHVETHGALSPARFEPRVRGSEAPAAAGAGASVAQTAAVRLKLILSLLLLSASAVSAEEWAFGASTGAWTFGDLAEVHSTIGNPISGETAEFRTSLSAETRPGAGFYLERWFNRRFSLRLDSTFTSSPLAVKTGSSDSSPSNDALKTDVGDLAVATFALPAVYRFNASARLRPLVFAGPAYVIYDIERNEASPRAPIFEGSRKEFGFVAGAGIEWWWSRRLAATASISDLVTRTPLRDSDFAGPSDHIEFDDIHNIHTRVGLSYRF